MSILKYIFELVIVYYVIKFVLNFIGTIFMAKQVTNKSNQNSAKFNHTANTENKNTTFTQPKKSMDIKDGEYIEYEEVKNERAI
jgi:hypothetical protein